MALLGPAAAQFWPFGGPQRQQQRINQQPRQQQQQYNPFGGWFDSTPQRQQQQRQQPQQQQQQQTDSSRAPPPSRRSAESTAAITTPIVVMGDSMADWLGSGLEDAFADRPEFGIVRKHRTVSGLVRYDPRRDVEWAQVAREIIAADKPKFIVMMIGYHDRQPIRERAPTPAGRPAAPQPSDDAELQDTDSPEGRAKASAAQQNEEMRKAARAKIEAQQKAKEAQQKAKSEAQQKAAPTGPMEFHSEDWQAAYIRRIDATIAAMRSANVPVFWVGLPPQRNPRAAQDTVYLNELFRSRAERAGIVYVDIWDGFVDEAGRYVLQGPDVEGQTRRLRSGDTVYFTKAGARKLAHYVEREIQRAMVNRAPTIALPAPEPAVRARPGAARPVAGPVIPLTAAIGGGNELLGGGTDQAGPGRSGRDQGAGARRADRGAVRPRRQFCLAAWQWRERRAGNAEGRGGCAFGRACNRGSADVRACARDSAAEAGAVLRAPRTTASQLSRSSRRNGALLRRSSRIPMRRGRRCRSRRRRRRRGKAGSGGSKDDARRADERSVSDA